MAPTPRGFSFSAPPADEFARLGRRLTALGPWLAFGTACMVYLGLSLAGHGPFHPGPRLGWLDLRVYRGAARMVLSGGPLYGGRYVLWMHFTYPPMAALAFTPLALAPLRLDEIVVTAIGLGALVAGLYFALALPGPGTGRLSHPENRPRRLRLAVLAAAVALWLEPVTSTLGYGQIDLVITLLVVWDLSRSSQRRTKGAMIGLAAGLKLTPLIFIPYLLLARRLRAAAVATLAFLATIAVSFVLIPADASRYWSGLFLDSRRTGGCCAPSNQSLRGALLGLAPSLQGGRLLMLIACVAIGGLLLAAAASRRGDEAGGFGICAITGLLVSPVSWSHHWALAAPALVLYAVRAWERRSIPGVLACAAIALIGYAYLPEWTASALRPGASSSPSPVWTLAADSYVVIGALVLAVCGWRESAGRSRRRRPSLSATWPARA